MLKGWVFPNKQEVFGQLVCPTLNEMNLVRKSFFARNVLLTQTSEHLDLMWQDVFFFWVQHVCQNGNTYPTTNCIDGDFSEVG